VKLFSRPYLSLIALIGVIVPRRIRADWREEWETELRHREGLLADWDRLDRAHKWELLRRSSSAFWDALCLQRQRWEDDIVQDLRFGVRLLVKSPAFTGVAVFTLALGIGTNTAIFSVVNALLLRPLDGVSDPRRLVQVSRQYEDRASPSDSTYPDYLDYRSQTSVISGLSVVVPTAFHLSARGQTERVDGELISSNYFDVLGVRAAQGRLIAPADDREDATGDVAVLSYRLWQRQFGGDPSVIGATIKLDGRSFVVIGVANERFAGTRIGTPRDVWVPILTLRRTDPRIAARLDQRRASWLEMFGRLKPGVTLDQARSEFSGIAARLERAYPDTNAHARVRVDPGLGRDVEVEHELRRFAYLPFTAATIVLLIACANVAGLLLARASLRKREIAARLALGAGRLRVIRQLLTESVVLALAGGAAGLVVGKWLTLWLRSLLPDRYLFLTFNVDFGVDWRVFTFMLAVATGTGMLFGLVPALQASRPDLVAALKASRSSRGSGLGGGARGTLVVAQVALSLMLLVAAGLCVRTLQNAAAIDTGYDVHHVLTARLDLAKQNYSEARGRMFQQQLTERLQATPSVDAAGLAVTLPLNDSRWENPVRRVGDPTRVQTFQNIVSARYFDVMNIPLVAGRRFAGADDEHAPRVAILNQRLARMMWPNEDPLGRRLTFKGQTLEVVGVVRDIKGRNLFEPPGPMLYLSITQYYEPTVVLQVRAGMSAAELVPVVQREVQALDRDLPVYNIKMLDDHLMATLTPQRLLAYLISGFGALALVLAGVGLYGLLSYTVTERTPEIGLRMALGAPRTQIVGLFLLQGLRTASVGIVLGLAAASGLTRLMKSVLFGVSPLDLLTLMAVTLLLTLASSIACYVPARRAARSDPNIALRDE
jgi:macrolide transport system ATP-binding/permease protein